MWAAWGWKSHLRSYWDAAGLEVGLYTDVSTSTKQEDGRGGGGCWMYQRSPPPRLGDEDDWQMSAEQLDKPHEKSGLAAGEADRVGWLAQVWLNSLSTEYPLSPATTCRLFKATYGWVPWVFAWWHTDVVASFPIPAHLTWHNDCAFKVQTVSFNSRGVSDGLVALNSYSLLFSYSQCATFDINTMVI